MGVLKFSDAPPEVFVVPRIDDELIDDLFYQEDEIGEMRHTAFMIECGLEEDPPDGPDVEPIPWLDNYSDSSSEAPKPVQQQPPTSSPGKRPQRPGRRIPHRTASADDIDVLEAELSPKKDPTRRRLVAAKSGTLRKVRREPPKKVNSVDSLDAVDENKSSNAPRGRRLVAVKSGSLHGMRVAAKKAMSKDEPPTSPSRSKLVATKSGTLHNMRRQLKEKKDKENMVSPRRGAFAKTKSVSRLSEVPRLPRDSSASPRKGKPPAAGKESRSTRTKVVKRNSEDSRKVSSSDEECDFLSDIDMSSHGSDVSISTDDECDSTPVVRKQPIKLKQTETTKPEKTPAPVKINKEKKEKKKKEKKEKKKKDKDKPDKDSKKKKKKKAESGEKTSIKAENVKATMNIFEKQITANETCMVSPPVTPRAKTSKVRGRRASVQDAMKNCHPGASPADLLRSAQGLASPHKSKSTSCAPSPSSTHRTRPGKLKIPKKSKSADELLPPAFRASSPR